MSLFSATLDSKKKKKKNFLLINEKFLWEQPCFLSKKEVHRRWKQEWASQEEYGDIAQAWGIKLGKPNWNLHTGLWEPTEKSGHSPLLQRWSQVLSTVPSSEVPSALKTLAY